MSLGVWQQLASWTSVQQTSVAFEHHVCLDPYFPVMKELHTFLHAINTLDVRGQRGRSEKRISPLRELMA